MSEVYVSPPVTLNLKPVGEKVIVVLEKSGKAIGGYECDQVLRLFKNNTL